MRSAAGLALLLLAGCSAMAQNIGTSRVNAQWRPDPGDTLVQRDAIDILRSVVKTRKPRTVLGYKTALYSVLPGVSYNSAAGFSPTLSANLVYYASPLPNQNLSIVYGLGSYGQHKQQTYWVFSSIWTPNNSYNFAGNMWFLKYTETTYGLGSDSRSEQRDPVSYNDLRIHQSALRKLSGDLFAGIGYALDHHYNIKQLGKQDGSAYNLSRYENTSSTISSGPLAHLLYDSRRNPINPYRGTHASIVYGPKFRFLGSDENWQSLTVDLRKYLPLGRAGRNVFALWGLAWLTLSGRPPYLDLPSIQWDDLQHTGRGYIQGRYRGKDMLYAEAEYRFAITQDGLLGGVMFANGQSYSGGLYNLATRILPAVGTGIRIRVNKYSRTNLCLDYAIGASGSRSFFFNLGEIF